jgi:putative DNA methylase
VRLLKPAELPGDWDPTAGPASPSGNGASPDPRPRSRRRAAAAALAAKLGSKAETARELCYRLYTLCERKKRAADAMAYNGLVQSWPEITRLAREAPQPVTPGTGDLYDPT